MSDRAIFEDAAPVAAGLPLSRRSKSILIEASLAVGGFAIGTGEFAIMGLLPDIAAGYEVALPVAGHAISAYALGVVVGAPVLAVLAAKLPRRTLLLALMALFAIGNLLSAVAGSYTTFVAYRFLTGLPHGAFFGIAALVAASMAAPGKRAQAVGRVMIGLTVATLVGTPAATWLGQVFGWRSLFVLVGLIGLLTVALLALFLERDRVREGASVLSELAGLRRPQVWLTLGVAAIGFGGMFAAFSYIAATATEVAGLAESQVPFVMMLFGAGMVIGNLVGSWLADKSLMGTIGGAMVFAVLVLSTFALTASSPVLFGTCVFLIGATVAVGPALQTRLIDVAGESQALAAALNHSAFNIANALGAWLGGLVIAAGYGFASTGWVGAVLGLVGLAVFAWSLAAERDTARAAAAAPAK